MSYSKPEVSLITLLLQWSHRRVPEVNENVAQSTVVVNDITQEIASVNQASSEVDSGSTQVQTSAEELSKLAEQLDAMVRRFQV